MFAIIVIAVSSYISVDKNKLKCNAEKNEILAKKFINNEFNNF